MNKQRRMIRALVFLFAIILILSGFMTTGRASALAPTPELEVIHHTQGDTLYLEFRLRHFEFIPEKLGQEPVYGEGYIQLYIDGKKMDKIFKSAYVYSGLTPGKHQVKVELIHHNHESYGIEEVFDVEVNQSMKDA